ncbi:hypothetical protein V8B97DRAFT_1915877 [Scleroderma yunnanense]
MSSQETDSVYITKCSDHTNSEHGSDSKVVQEDNLVKLTSDEVDILQEHLEEWKTLKGDKRNMDWSIKGQLIKYWLYNNGRSQSRKGLLKWGQRWTAWRVIRQQKKVEIQEELQTHGIEPGTQAMIGEYQKAVGAVMKKLTKEELDEASHVAEEWNNTQLAPEVQAQAAEKKGHQYARAFAENMWKQFGTRVVVMVTWKDTKGKLMTGMHDFNDELGDDMAFLEWESIQDKWSTYATDVFDTKEMVDGEEINEGVGRNRRVQKGKKRPLVPLSTSEDGTPQIPNILDIHALEKDIMRSLVTFHYHKQLSLGDW